MRAFILLLICFTGAPASAYFQLDLLKGKKGGGARKESVTWTLADWLTQKNKIALADQWLAAHMSGRWFEFNTSAGHNRFWLKTTDVNGTVNTARDAQSYTLDVYLSILNLYADYEKASGNEERYSGAAGLRLLGSSAQSTSLVGRYGWARRQNLVSGEHWDNPYAEGLLQLYVVKQFGLNGQYRYFISRDSNHGTRMEGHRGTAGAFLENRYFRVFANYYLEPLKIGPSGSAVEERREGYEAGVKLYF